ncbi:MAG: hypothetical protein EBT45_06725 [Alphaproteobacteria bacterium]|nr:hypothetical protein [Alphaproteobacteria bacterium]
MKDPNLEELLSDWQFYYNWHRPHSSLEGKTPQEKHIELLYKTPFWEDVGKMFDSKKEHIVSHNYQTAFRVKILKPSL